MKLLALKLISLLVLLGCVLVLLLTFQVQAVVDAVAYVGPDRLLADGDHLSLSPWGYLLCVVALLLSLYAFLPRWRGTRATLIFPGEHGEVVVQLGTVQATLTKLLRRMDEVNTIELTVRPDQARSKAVIVADITLNRVPGLSTREATRRVSHYITHAAGEILGLEDVATIKLNIRGVKVNAKASSKDLTAVAPAPVAAAAAVAAPLVTVTEAPDEEAVEETPEEAPTAEVAEEEVQESEELPAADAWEAPASAEEPQAGAGEMGGEEAEEPPVDPWNAAVSEAPAPEEANGEAVEMPGGALEPEAAESAEDGVLGDTEPVVTPWENEDTASAGTLPPYSDPMPPAFVTPTPLDPHNEMEAEEGVEETVEADEADEEAAAVAEAMPYDGYDSAEEPDQAGEAAPGNDAEEHIGTGFVFHEGDEQAGESGSEDEDKPYILPPLNEIQAEADDADQPASEDNETR